MTRFLLAVSVEAAFGTIRLGIVPVDAACTATHSPLIMAPLASLSNLQRRDQIEALL